MVLNSRICSFCYKVPTSIFYFKIVCLQTSTFLQRPLLGSPQVTINMNQQSSSHHLHVVTKNLLVTIVIMKTFRRQLFGEWIFLVIARLVMDKFWSLQVWQLEIFCHHTFDNRKFSIAKHASMEMFWLPQVVWWIFFHY